MIKRSAILLVFLLLSSLELCAQIQLVQVRNNVATSATAVTLTVTTTTGNLILVSCGQNVNTSSTITMSDTASNTWTQIGSYAGTAGARMGVFVVPNSTGITSVTCTWSGSISGRIAIQLMEFSGAATSSPSDGSVTSATSSATSLPSGSFSTTNANDVIIYAVTGSDSGGTSTADTSGGYAFPTNGDAGSTQRSAIQCKVVTATQSNITTTMSWPTNATAQGLFFGIKSATASVGTCTWSANAPPPVINKQRKLEQIDSGRFVWRRELCA